MKQTKICRKCKKEFVTYSKYKYLCKKCSVCQICGEKQYSNLLCKYHYQRKRNGYPLIPKCVECGGVMGRRKIRFCKLKCYKKYTARKKINFYHKEKERIYKKVIKNTRKVLEKI